MSRLSPKAITVGLITTAVILTATTVALRARPIGFFDSRPIIGYHGAGDVLRFQGAQVTWETCCGDNPMGVYFRSNAIWIWRVRDIDWAVTPGVTQIDCRELAHPTNIFFLRRRLFAPSETGHQDVDVNE